MNLTDQQIAARVLLHVSLIEGIGAAYCERIIKAVLVRNAHWTDLYSWTIDDFKHSGLSEVIAQKIVVGLTDLQLVHDELALIAQYGVQWVACIEKERYPSLLLTINAPPPILYWYGNEDVMHRSCVALIGSRNATNYAQKIIERLVPALVTHDMVVVSGGALGADAMAHQTTLRYGGNTIVVMGSGLLKLYPKQHISLFDEIVARGGMLLSIFPLRTQALSSNFPIRNRIISGLSKAVVVVQAAAKSGTSITADYALGQGRDVYAVPGDIDDPLSSGCHHLLQQGAGLITSATDLLQYLGVNTSLSHNIAPIPDIVSMPVMSVHRDTVDDSGKQSVVKNSSHIIFNTDEQRLLYQLCRDKKTLHDLVASSCLPMQQVGAILFELQCEGLVMQDHAGRWCQQ